MHEMHLLKDLFRDLTERVSEEKAGKVTKIYLKMGELTEINEDILRAYFSEQGKGTALENAVLEIEKGSARELRLVSFDCE